MQGNILALFLTLPGAAASMAAAGAAMLVIALWAAKYQVIQARGLDKIAALRYLCFAVPLAVFGAEHFAIRQSMVPLVPPYLPARIVWVDLIGVALIAAAVSIATRRLVAWSGLLFGVMMFLFVAMIHLPGAIRTGGRIPWTIVVRELSFGSGGLVLAGVAMARNRGELGKRLIAVGRVIIAGASIFFGVEHFLHPLGLPGVPLPKQMPPWVPVPTLIDYATGALLISGGVCFLLARKTRLAAIYVGCWIVFLVVVIYVPVMAGALANPNPGLQIEGVNYFADTLLFGATILSLAGLSDAS